jgi:murein DD-endopeptidase MepM/ murein hydrolase activator NlpD
MAALVGAVPAGAAESDPFAAAPRVDAVLRYPLTMPVTGTVESLIGGGCPSARSHSGVDVSSPHGEPTDVHAVFPGVARSIDTGNGYGLTVEIVHVGDGPHVLSRYAHLSGVSVPPEGRWVEQGEVIGRTGATGNAETVHLHFELRDAADGVVDLNPAFPPCRQGVVAGAPLAIPVPGLVSPAARAVAALGPGTWAATGVGPRATALGGSECRYWDRATDGDGGRCDGGGDGSGGDARPDGPGDRSRGDD